MQLFELFGGENFGKGPSNLQNSPMFSPTNVFHYTVLNSVRVKLHTVAIK